MVRGRRRLVFGRRSSSTPCLSEARMPSTSMPSAIRNSRAYVPGWYSACRGAQLGSGAGAAPASMVSTSLSKRTCTELSSAPGRSTSSRYSSGCSRMSASGRYTGPGRVPSWRTVCLRGLRISWVMGRLSSAGLHRDLARPVFGCLRKPQREHAVAVDRLHLLCVDRHGQVERAAEAAHGPLAAMHARALLAGELALAAQGHGRAL